MADLNLKGTLKLVGSLDLRGSGGTVKVEEKEALVVGATGTGTPILVTDASGNPIDDGTNVEVTGSLNQTVKAKGTPIVVAGSPVVQGNYETWHGVLDAGTSNVKASGDTIGVVGDEATIPPTSTAIITESGQ